LWRRSGRTGRRRLGGAIYARFSSRFQHSIEDQVRACREWAEQHDIAVPDAFIFVDRAKSGRIARRQGLKALRDALATGDIDVVIVFTTNRLFRKTYQSLAFVEEEIVDRGKRCVFIRSGVDTADAARWRQLLQMHAMIDEFVVQMAADHVRAAHEGLLIQTRVFGTVTYGFAGQPIPGEVTKLGRPRRLLIVDPETSAWVQKVFSWFVTEESSITEIVRRLNAEGAPLPPRSRSGRWTYLAVRRLLGNARYRGLWEYGRTTVNWLNKQGYSRQVPRPKPLRSVQIEALRIIDDGAWQKAQERLARLGRGGRPAKDGDRKSRPRVLNGLLICAVHQRPLYVGGSHGKYLFCRACQESGQPALVTLVPRELALEMLTARLVEFLQLDNDLVERIIAACQRQAAALQQPDAKQVEDLRQQEARLTRQIQFILDAPGETAQDEAENRAKLQNLRGERARITRQRVDLDEAARRPAVVPTADQIRELLVNLAQLLARAADGGELAELAAARRVIQAMTGGRILVSQQGEAKAKRGWLRATFRVRPLAAVGQSCGCLLNEEGGEVVIDFRKPALADRLAERAKALYDAGLPFQQIARQLGVNRNLAREAVARWHAQHGQQLPDGRSRRARLDSKYQKQPKYQEIVEDVMRLFREGVLLQGIAERLEVDRNTVTKAVVHWHTSRGMPVPDGRTRRKQLPSKFRPGEPPEEQASSTPA
jgi:hypothetical protein